MKLTISNKPYSPWPMRVWVLMRQLDIEFDEEIIDLSASNKLAHLKAVSPSGRVPVLADGQVQVWDSMAIIEYLHERFPEKAVWPSDAAARAFARSICNEMHSGFAALRGRLVMNTRRKSRAVDLAPAVQADVARIVEIIETTLSRFGGQAGFLFDAFSAADAFFAPIVNRFDSYSVSVTPTVKKYMAAVGGLPPYKAWCADAQMDPWRNEAVDKIV